MSRWPVATAIAAALLWLSLGTQASLPVLTRGAEDWSGDFRSYYLPNAEFAANQLAQGRLPLWNPYQGAGGPFLATVQPGVLYPPNWLHLLLPPENAFLALIALHLALAAVTASALAQRLGASPIGASIAGLAYATSFQVLASVWTPPLVYTAAWMPAVLLAVDRLIDRPTASSTAALAAVTALLALAGWPYTLALTALVCGLYAAGRLLIRVVRDRAIPWRVCAALAAGVVIGMLLAAPQLLPASELLARSCRALGSIIEEQAIFVPGPHDPEIFIRSTLRRGFNDGVPGYAALLLAPLALLLPGPHRGRVALLLAIGGFGLLASFPGSFPVYSWLRELPVLADFRFPYRYRLLSTLALSIAAGVGASHLQHAVRRFPHASSVVGGVALIAALGWGTLPVLNAVSPFSREFGLPQTVAEQIARIGANWNPEPYERVYWTGRSHKIRDPNDVFVVHDMEPLTLARTAQLLTFFETGQARTLLTLEPSSDPRKKHEDWVAAPYFGWLNLPGDSARAVILDLFSVGTILDRSPPYWLADRYERISPAGAETVVFHNPHALPRAYRVAVAIREPAKLAGALRLMASEHFDPRAMVLLDDPPAPLLRRRRPVPFDPNGVEIELYLPEMVRLKTRGRNPAIVVLTDAYFPGWMASVDGRPVDLYRANANFRGVAVPAGEHVIEMRYAPRSMATGGWLAVLGVLGIAAALWRSRSGSDGSVAAAR
ncbi:MAG: YfhO family protein [Myxococcota bacterium]